MTTTTTDLSVGDAPSSARPSVRARDLGWPLQWASARLPELALFGFGVLLRFAALRSYAPELGYDFFEHELTVSWWTTHFRMPPFLLSRGSYHPQLYYLLCGLLKRMGGSMAAVQAFSALLGAARLAVMWWALERYLRQHRVARLLALALAAVLPVSVEMDVTVTQEPLNNLLSLLFAVCAIELCSAADDKRVRWALKLGVVMGLGLLTKVSNLVLVGVLGATALLELVQRSDLPARKRIARLSAWAVAASVALAMSAPQYAYNREVYGKALLDGWYRRPTTDVTRVAAHRKEVLDRRSLGFVSGFSTDVVRFPYYPSGIEPTPRFWSVLIASTYADYFNYRFGPASDAGGTLEANTRYVGGRVSSWAKLSVASGIGIAVLVLAGWLVAMRGTLAAREVARPGVLLMPAFGLCGAIYFATQYPYDFEGVIKGHYFLFVCAPLYAVFGASVAWLLRRRVLVPVGWLAAALVISPAIYSSLCVFR